MWTLTAPVIGILLDRLGPRVVLLGGAIIMALGFAMAAKVEEKLIGRLTHYYSHLSVGIIELSDADLDLGDVIHIKGTHTDFKQTVDSIQVEHQNVSHAERGKSVGIKVKEKVREHDQVFRLSE